MNPVSSELHLHMGYAMQKSGRLEDATYFYSEALRLDPSNFEATANMGTTLHTLGALLSKNMLVEMRMYINLCLM